MKKNIMFVMVLFILVFVCTACNEDSIEETMPATIEITATPITTTASTTVVETTVAQTTLATTEAVAQSTEAQDGYEEVDYVEDEYYPSEIDEPVVSKGYRACYLETLDSTKADSHLLYDINKDGIPELIIRENFRIYYVYTSDNEASYKCGRIDGSSISSLHSSTGNELVVYGAAHRSDGFGSDAIDFYTLEGTVLTYVDSISTGDMSSDDIQRELKKYPDLGIGLIYTNYPERYLY